MVYNLKGKKNTLIWDGLDAGITEKEYETKCPCCANRITYFIKDCVSINEVDSALIDYLEENKVISAANGVYEIKKGIPGYVVPQSCDRCGSELWLIVGMKEIQPQRYEIYYKSAVYKSSDS